MKQKPLSRDMWSSQRHSLTNTSERDGTHNNLSTRSSQRIKESFTSIKPKDCTNSIKTEDKITQVCCRDLTFIN